jgi:hypothetical protein
VDKYLLRIKMQIPTITLAYDWQGELCGEVISFQAGVPMPIKPKWTRDEIWLWIMSTAESGEFAWSATDFSGDVMTSGTTGCVESARSLTDALRRLC